MIVSDDNNNNDYDDYDEIANIPVTVLEEYSGHGVHGIKPVLLYEPTPHSPGAVGFDVGLNDGAVGFDVGLNDGFLVSTDVGFLVCTGIFVGV